jgi:hypothetical protein
MRMDLRANGELAEASPGDATLSVSPAQVNCTAHRAGGSRGTADVAVQVPCLSPSLRPTGARALLRLLRTMAESDNRGGRGRAA